MVQEAHVLAQRAMRSFAGRLQKMAFLDAASQEDVTLMPSAERLQEAAKQLEVGSCEGIDVERQLPSIECTSNTSIP